MKKISLLVFFAIIILTFLVVGRLTGFITSFPPGPGIPGLPENCDCTYGECCDGCYFKTVGISCGTNKECDTIGNCLDKTLPCSADCLVLDSKECSGNSYKTCGNYDNDSCLEWSNLVLCLAEEQCNNGNCIKKCTESDWSYDVAPLTCPQTGQQTKTWNKIGQCLGGVSKPATETISCNYQTPTCISFVYSSWGNCQPSGVQTRQVISSLPSGCQGGNPVISETCAYIPDCTENDWASTINPVECPESEKQTKLWIKSGNCENGVSKPATETISCQYKYPTCTSFAFSDWGECLESSIQTRIVTNSFPAGCQGGSPLLIATCEYVPFCVANQTILCDNIKNGIVSGYKNKCDVVGTSWTNKNTCELSCKSGFVKNFDKCLADNYLSEFKIGDLNIAKIAGKIILKEIASNISVLEVSGGLEDSIFENIEIVRSERSEAREYIIVRNFSIENKTKAVYIEKKNSSSNAVCIRDNSIVRDREDILSNCTKLACPERRGEYKCVVEGNVFIVSGLTHSGVIEDSSYCGDGICLGSESCSSCSQDCGNCPATQTTGHVGGGGGSLSSSTSTSNISRQTNETDTQSTSKTNELGLETNKAESGDIIYWIIAISILIVILIIVIFLIIKNKSKTGKSGLISNEDETNEKINPLIEEGLELIENSEKDKARELYKKVF